MLTLYPGVPCFRVYFPSNSGFIIYFRVSVFRCLLSVHSKKSAFIGANVIKRLYIYRFDDTLSRVHGTYVCDPNTWETSSRYRQQEIVAQGKGEKNKKKQPQ
ncbi:unnamed protein product [Ixodes pacificus]